MFMWLQKYDVDKVLACLQRRKAEVSCLERVPSTIIYRRTIINLNGRLLKQKRQIDLMKQRRLR